MESTRLRLGFPLLALVAIACGNACGNNEAPNAGGTAPETGDAGGAGAIGEEGGPEGLDAATSDANPPSSVKAGSLLFGVGAPIVGAEYTSGAEHGTTDASGGFRYEDGAPVTFQIGDLMLGAPRGAATLSPYQVADSASCEETDGVTKLLAVLEALDADANFSNGITLPAAAATGATKTLAATSLADLTTYVSALGGKPLPTAIDAVHGFVPVFDGEAWTTLTTDTFPLTQAALRGQGVTTDGTSWFFSGTTGLERTDTSFTSTRSNLIAIPLSLVLAGSDHIGDIDYWMGNLYAPIEDKTYAAPKVVLFDPSSLAAGTIYAIPQNLQTKGVPWVAVDGPRRVAYLAEWDPTLGINVFTLSDMTFQRTIPLSVATGRVQGAKVYKGQLYMSVDDTEKHVLKVHLASGTLFEVLALHLPTVEEEGIAFFARGEGSLMHTLDVPPGRKSVEFRHHQITREPLRWKVCP